MTFIGYSMVEADRNQRAPGNPDPSIAPSSIALGSIALRQHWMAVLARAGAEEISACLSDCPPLPVYRRLRGPEAGLVMVQGRQGGGGSAFNLGEMTVTRCTVARACSAASFAARSARSAASRLRFV